MPAYKRSNRRYPLSTFGFLIAVLPFLPTGAHSQDFSQTIRTAAEASLRATVKGDYETLMHYTYPPLVTMMDKVAGGKGKGIDLLKGQMEKLRSEGTTMDSGVVGTPTRAVQAGKELIAIVPTVIYMTTPQWYLKQESYMIAVSSDAGKNWTFVNGSDNTEQVLPILFPEWNKELTLPAKKGPDVIRREQKK